MGRGKLDKQAVEVQTRERGRCEYAGPSQTAEEWQSETESRGWINREIIKPGTDDLPASQARTSPSHSSHSSQLLPPSQHHSLDSASAHRKLSVRTADFAPPLHLGMSQE